jgi:hypothetical protein
LDVLQALDLSTTDKSKWGRKRPVLTQVTGPPQRPGGRIATHHCSAFGD